MPRPRKTEVQMLLLLTQIRDLLAQNATIGVDPTSSATAVPRRGEEAWAAQEQDLASTAPAGRKAPGGGESKSSRLTPAEQALRDVQDMRRGLRQKRMQRQRDKP